jgi:hypothetical protein
MASDEKVPRKYWWVAAAVVPITLGLIAIVPSLIKPSPGPGAGTNTTITGNNNTVSFDYSTRNTFVIDVNVIAREYELQTGRPLSDDLRRQIEAAVSAATQNNHTESIRLLEQVAQAAPVPAIYNNLGIEYAKTQNVEASRRAFELSKTKIAEIEAAAAKNRPLSETALKAPTVSGPGVRTESSAVPAMTIDAFSPPYEPPAEIHVVAHGTAVSGRYQVKYQPEPGTPVVMEPGAYDVLMKVDSAGFIVASNVVVREGTLTRIDPNALVGGIAVEPVSKKGFPLITKLEFVDRSSGDKRLLAQQTEKLGVTLPIAPGTYDVIGTTTYDQHVEIAGNIPVRAREITRFDTLGQVAAIVVRAPNVKGLNMKAVYALKAGTNTIAAKAEAWDVPMLVAGGVSYDIALEQSAGLTRIRSGITPARGELVEIR